MIPPDLLQILACPLCKGKLTPRPEESALYCNPCGRTYPVVDGIPQLLPGEAAVAPEYTGNAS